MKKLKLILICLIIILLGIFAYLKIYINSEVKDSEHIISNVKIDNIEVGGLDRHECKKLLENRVFELQSSKIILKVKDKKTAISAKNMNLRIGSKEIDEVVSEAVNLGRKGFIVNRAFDVRRAKNGGVSLILKKHISDGNIKNMLEIADSKLLKNTKDAYLVETAGKPKIVKEVRGYKVDSKNAFNSLKKSIENSWRGKDLISEIAVKYVPPKVTADMLSSMKDKIGSFTTSYPQYDVNRCRNIENGTRLINGSYLKSGENFSVHDSVAPFSYENGYYKAGAFENGDIVQEYGGGICQVATTLYNAVIRAELDVLERHNHYMTISYVPLSFDAAIAGSDQDLKIKNSSKHPIYIMGTAGNGKVTFSIYGTETRDKNRRIEFENRVLSSKRPKKKVIKKDSDLKKGKEKVKFPGSIGYVAELWKKVYIDGKLIKKYKFNTSHYAAVPKRVILGTKKGKDDKKKDKKKDKSKESKHKD